jgi:hypothetical protein
MVTTDDRPIPWMDIKITARPSALFYLFSSGGHDETRVVERRWQSLGDWQTFTPPDSRGGPPWWFVRASPSQPARWSQALVSPFVVVRQTVRSPPFLSSHPTAGASP